MSSIISTGHGLEIMGKGRLEKVVGESLEKKCYGKAWRRSDTEKHGE